MPISPDQLIEAALENLKHKLAAAVPWDEPIPPAALEKLSGAVREAADALRGRGIRNVRGDDILAFVRDELNSRLAGSLKAGALLPNELSPEIVKWLAGTPLAIQIANLIRPGSQSGMAGGAVTGNVVTLRPPDLRIGAIHFPPVGGPIGIVSNPPGDHSENNGPINIIASPPGDQTESSGPIYIMAKPPGDQTESSGPIYIIAKPPGDQTESSGPIYIIAKPPGDQTESSGPIYIIAKPPGDQTEPSGPIYIVARPPSGGSSGGSKKGRSRLRWLLPAGLIAAIILFLAGTLAGSIGKGSRPAPTATVGIAVGVSGKTYTVTPSQTSVPSFTGTPTVSATCTPAPTDTLTATFTGTDTPTPTATPAYFFQVIVEPKHIYYRGTGCGDMQSRFQVKVADPAKVAGVWMFVRLINKEATEVTGWSGALVMAAAGSGWYVYTLYAEDIPEYTKYPESRVLYQFVAYDSRFKAVASSGVSGDVELSACGK